MTNKNRKDKIRKIIVNGIEYYWGVFDYNCDGDGGCRFNIYKDKKIIYQDIIHNKIITPISVREKILEINYE